MKGHKAHHHRHPRAEHAKGGTVKHVESPMEGDWAHDEAPSEVYAGKGSNVEKEAKQKKHGGRAKRKHGGHVKHVLHHHDGHVKHVGAVHGKVKHHAGRKPRKAGGRAGSDMNPLSSAHAGKHPAAHKDVEID